MRCRSILALLLCYESGIHTLHAQIAGGNVSGAVIDASGGSVPHAKVVLKSLATQVTRALNVNLAGIYTAPNLLPGEYVLER